MEGARLGNKAQTVPRTARNQGRLGEVPSRLCRFRRHCGGFLYDLRHIYGSYGSALLQVTAATVPSPNRKCFPYVKKNNRTVYPPRSEKKAHTAPRGILLSTGITFQLKRTFQQHPSVARGFSKDKNRTL